MANSELGALPGFQAIGEADLAAVAELCERQVFAPGTALVEQGARDRHALILLDGEAEVAIKLDLGTVVVASLGPGTIVGEISLLCETPRTATVTAVTTVTALAIAPPALPALVRRSPEFALLLLHRIAERLEGNVQAIAYFKMAAQAIEAGRFDLDAVTALARRGDEISAFAHAFTGMARAVQERHETAERRLQALTFEIDELRQHRVAAVLAETRQLDGLLDSAAALRARRNKPKR
jgi:CRP-like cAMP-binding protein